MSKGGKKKEQQVAVLSQRGLRDELDFFFFPRDEKCCFAHKYLRMIKIPDLSLPIT